VGKEESAGLLKGGLPRDKLKIIYSPGKQIIAELKPAGKTNWKELDKIFHVEPSSGPTNPGTGSS